MNLNFLCCIGAELKNSVQQTTRMTQVYLYRAFEEETIADMLATGFFNDALGIIRQDDLLLLYSPNETTSKYVYARVSSVSRDGVEIEKVNIRAEEITVDTTGYSNLSGDNLQQILNNLDTLLTTMQGAYVKIDGTSIMSGPLKMRAGSMQCAIAPYWDGVGFFKLNSNDSVTMLASMETPDGFCPAANNTYNLGKTNYKWKDLYVARVIAGVLNNGANINIPTTGGTLGLNDFSNITDSAKNISNWSSNVSNCLTEIPQDIKLELNNGTLTHKVGSKFYTPDGTDHTVSTSSSVSTASSDGQYFVYCASISGNLQNFSTTSLVSRAGSGSSLPADGTTYSVFFNTSDNKIYRYTGGGWSEWGVGFPLAIVTVSGGVISSIDQVFNGFGYIGSTVFALPGTTQLIPNGFNADGTLNNTKITANTVQTRTLTVTVSNAVLAARFNVGTPFGVSGYGKYDESRNINTSSGVDWNYGFVGTISASSGSITSFTTKQVFHALDYNDTEFIAHQATPSDKYVDMTLPASGNAIVAPADGYFAVGKNATASGQRLRMWYRGTNSGDLMSASTWSSIAANLEISLYVAKGSGVVFAYSADGTTNYCRFIYANGAK